MNAENDIRLIKCLDGLHFSFALLDDSYSDLQATCAEIPKNETKVVRALAKCWMFIDLVHRIRQIGQALPGLSGTDSHLTQFLKKTELAEHYRHYIQHLRSELSKKDVNPFPVWGTIGWVDRNDDSVSHFAVIGACVGETQYSGCVFDTVERRWVSTVTLSIDKSAFHFDPIYDACTDFRQFIVPWVFDKYKRKITLNENVPIVTMKFVSHKNDA